MSYCRLDQQKTKALRQGKKQKMKNMFPFRDNSLFVVRP